MRSSCSNGARDLDEADVDCGGATCDACAGGKRCLKPSDCSSGRCSGDTCQHAAPAPVVETVVVHGSGSLIPASGEPCTSRCTYTRPGGSALSLTAAPAPGWQLETWTDCTPSSGSLRCGQNSLEPIHVAFTNPLWTQVTQDPASVEGQFSGITEVTGGDIIGWGRGGIARYDETGRLLWRRPFDGVDPMLLTSSGAGDLFVTGILLDTGLLGGPPLTCDGLRQWFLSKFDRSGAHQWSRCLEGAQVQDLLLLEGGDLLLVERPNRVLDAGTTAFVRRSGAEGRELARKEFRADSKPTSLVRTIGGRYVLSGQVVGAANFGGGPLPPRGSSDIVLAGFGPDLEPLWSKRLGSTAQDEANLSTVLEDGSVVVAGHVDDLADLGCGPRFPTRAEGPRAFMLRLDPVTGGIYWVIPVPDAFGPAGLLAQGNVIISSWESDPFHTIRRFDADRNLLSTLATSGMASIAPASPTGFFALTSGKLRRFPD